MTSRTLLLLGASVGVASILLGLSLRTAKHDEDALLTDWSAPPPLPIFVAVNVLAGTLRAMADALTPPPIRMVNLGFAYHITMLAHVCQKFQIPDFLASGPKTVAQIAQHMNTADHDRVERLLYAMAAEGITKLDPTTNKEHPLFVNSVLSATLRRDHPNSVAGWVGHNVEDLWNVWGALPDMFGPDALSSGWEKAWPQYPTFWSLLEADNDREVQFGHAMQAVDGLGGAAMALDGPFAKFSRIIDVGGSMGHFVYKVLKQNPSMTGVLYDRPHVIAQSKKLWHQDGGEYHDSTSDRLQIIAGDFFHPDSGIPEALDGDVYHLRYILHDWSDEDCLTILKAIKDKMGNNKKATLLIGESAMPDRHTVGVPPVIHHIDVQMMVIFAGAKERTPKMWTELLAKAGFGIVAFHPTRSLVHYLEAVPIKEMTM